MNTSRRKFLQQSSLLAASTLLAPHTLFAQKKFDPHAEVCLKTFELAKKQGLPDKSMNEIVAAIGQSFVDAPYKAHTLEGNQTEKLVVNLKEFDCVTFVEATLALARCVKMHKMTFEEFKRQLQFIRYRDGIIDGYASRLHYFSDWIDNNVQKGVLKNMAPELQGVPYEKPIHFMTRNRESYKQLASEGVYQAITGVETKLNLRRHMYIPKSNVLAVRDNILDGDIIGITTAIEGLDITHTGFALRFMNYQRFLHAPLSGQNIQITKRTIVDYLGQDEKRTGIMVARPLDPEESIQQQ